MKKIKLVVDTGFTDCKYEETVEVDDDVTNSELDDIAEEFMLECISCYWKEVE